MVNGFKKRRIATPKSLGEVLREARDQKEMTIESAESACKVKAKYLVDLEAGNWQALPSLAYVRGFVLAYAKCLALDKKETEELFWQEYGFIDSQGKENLSYKKVLGEKKVLITPKLTVYTAFAVFLIAMFSYIGYQIIGFAGSPALHLMNPANNSIIETESVNIRGLTDNGNYLKINNETVPVTTDGHFSTVLKLTRGTNVVQVVASNRAQKETKEVVIIEYKPKTAMVELPANP